MSYVNPDLAGQKAFKLFTSPRNKKITDKQKAWLIKHQKSQITIGGQKIKTYHIPGKGKKILLAHGWESNAYRWKTYCTYLSELDYDIYLLDAPGHGLTEGSEFTPHLYAEAMQSICASEKVEILLGHSAGAYAIIMAMSELDFGPHVSDLILLAPTGNFEKMVQQFYKILSLNKRVRKAFEKICIDRYGHSFAYYNSYNMIKKIEVKGLLIHDKKDNVLPIEYSHKIHESWKNSQFITFDGHGHRLRSQAVLDAILNYLKGNQ